MFDFKLPEITPEYLEECFQRSYEEDRAYPENFSNWYYHINDFGKFKHAEVISNQIFTPDEVRVFQSSDYKDKLDWDKIKSILKPTLDKMKSGMLYNIKNGCFSNKFDFNTCLTDKFDLPFKLWDINEASNMFSTGGYTELVVRQWLPYDDTKTLTIYRGMPLREELRVFYNLDTKQIEYIVDYWDYDYCYKNIHNITDRIALKHFHNIEHSAKILKYMKYVEDNIHTLKFDAELTGIWSIDFMAFQDELYLIDMARGFRSAYWNPEKLKNK